ncbi:MAG: hypothetical protein MUF83_04365 [Acidimicrobiales bacterium]|nr:hypothetical protein [Acidimicrobiales bacterium]
MAVTLKSSPTRRVLLAVSALLALFGTFLVFTGSASAHHSEISGSADCDGLVTWTAEAWNGSTEAERTNGSVKVWYRIGGGSAVDVATGSFNKANGYQFDGSFTWPDAGATSLVLYVQEQQNWANGAGIGSARSTTVSLPTNCPTPEVGVSATCTTVTVTSTKDISNIVWQAQNGAEGKFDGLSGLTYTFPNDPANPIVKVWVKSANNFLKPGDPAPNGNWGQGVGTYLSVPVPTGCQGTPQVSSAVACANGNGDVTITLKNTAGYLPVTFTVTDPRTNQAQQVQVAVGETKTVTLTGFADGEHTIPVSAGNTSYAQTVQVTCDRPGVPEATVSLECVEGDGVATVTLRNTGGDLPVTFSVRNPATGQTTNHQVAVGQTKTVVLGDLPDGTHTVEIRSGTQNFDQTITVSCDRPGVGSVSVSQVCVEGDGVVTVTLSNTSGDLPIEFEVTNPATNDKTTVTVAVGESEQVVLGDLPGAGRSARRHPHHRHHRRR